MEQEKFGNFIKTIRKKYNLTQKQLADKYNITYQAVSKWENGKNMPDISLIKKICEDFNVSFEEIFNDKIKEQKYKLNKKILFVLGLIIIIFISIILVLYNSNNFVFRTLSSNCDEFNISGNIAYNNKKTSIYITNIIYCGEEDTEEYKRIDCSLYEKINNVEKKISSYSYNKEKNIKLEEFLKTVTFSVDDYKSLCKEHSKNDLYLIINAKKNNNKIITYKIPLTLNKNCSK